MAFLEHEFHITVFVTMLFVNICVMVFWKTTFISLCYCVISYIGLKAFQERGVHITVLTDCIKCAVLLACD